MQIHQKREEKDKNKKLNRLRSIIEVYHKLTWYCNIHTGDLYLRRR